MPRQAARPPRSTLRRGSAQRRSIRVAGSCGSAWQELRGRGRRQTAGGQGRGQGGEQGSEQRRQERRRAGKAGREGGQSSPAAASQPVSTNALSRASRARSISSADTVSGGMNRRVVPAAPAVIRINLPSRRQCDTTADVCAAVSN